MSFFVGKHEGNFEDMLDINYWLEHSEDYESGRLLYEKYGGSSFLNNMLKYGDTAFNREKLRTALEDILNNPGMISTPKAKKKNPVIDKSEPELIEDDDLFISTLSKPLSGYPDKIKDLIREAISSYNQAGKMHRELRMNKRVLGNVPESMWPYLTVEERKMNALRILKLRRASKEAWRKVDFYEQTGGQFGGEVSKELPSDAFELEKMRQNLSSNVSKWKKKLQNADSKERKELAKDKLAQYEAQLQEVEIKLNK